MSEQLTVTTKRRSSCSRADITARRQSGESLASIGKSYGVTRERIRQLCNRWGVQSPVDLVRTSPELIEKAVALLADGETIADAAAAIGVNSGTLARHIRPLGLDLASCRAAKRSHRFDGRRFGLWSVVDGTYDSSTGNSNKRSVECRCECGTVRRVVISALLSGMSRGCGCRNRGNGPASRKRVPWRCKETNEQLPHTAALAAHLGVNAQLILRRLNRGTPYVDPAGRTWLPLRDQAVAHNPSLRTP